MIRNSPSLFLILFLSGCSMIYTRLDSPVDVGRLQDMDETTRFDDVLDALGPPSRVSALPGGFVFLYESMNFREMQLGISGPASFQWLSLIKLTLADADLQHQVLVFTFRSNGTLSSVSSMDEWEDIGNGGAVQFLVSVTPIVDTSDYQDDPDIPLKWGWSLCAPLPQVLNMPHGIRSGSSGVEQSGTPDQIGQQTLEMN